MRIKDPVLRREARALRRMDPGTAERRGTIEVWNELERAKQAREAGDARLRAAVTAARKAGLTWRDIAAALGTSHQAAMQRYGRDELRRQQSRPRRAAAG
jgi:hypothetical protein